MTQSTGTIRSESALTMQVAIQTQTSQGYSFKEWRQGKQEIEEEIIKNLMEALRTQNVEIFRSALESGTAQLEEIYLKMPPSSANAENENVSRNRKLRTFLGEVCKTDVKSEFLIHFLHFLPIANEPIQQLQGQYLLHIALGSLAFGNAKTLLLGVANIDVNVTWKKQTPLMVLFKVATIVNFQAILELVELLAERGADINLGDYTAHPLSVLCRLATLDVSHKRRLCELCAERFECDVDSLYEGQARKDIERLFPDLQFMRRHSEVTAMTLRSYLLAFDEERFLESFEAFYKNNGRLLDAVELLHLAATKRFSRSVEEICTKICDADLLQYKKHLAKTLKIVCSNGYPEVLELFLTYLRQPEIFNELPLALYCVRSMSHKRKVELEECFDMLLNDDKVSIAKCDGRGETALSLAKEYDMEHEVRCIIENELRYSFEQQ